jgi:glycosyltransferase involved in cell wall biosynthesis
VSPSHSSAAPVGVHQFVPALIPRDATGSHTLLLRDALRAAGWRSEIYAEATHDELIGESIPLEHYEHDALESDVLIYQFSTSSVVAEFLARRTEPLIIDYHNVTGPEHYEGWEPATAERARRALEQLKLLGPRAVLGLADSAFNEADLLAAGCRRTQVVPVLVDHHRLGTDVDARIRARLMAEKSSGGADWLFVGRIVPSKAQHELIKALWSYRRLYDPAARLHLVGSAPSGRYLRTLRSFLSDLDLVNAVRITGEVSDATLGAYFATADIYVSLSVHEGFGVPLIEAMHSSMPVVALATGAVPATVGDAGLLLDRSDPTLVAATVHRVLSDEELRRRLVAAGSAQVARLSLELAARAAIEAVASVAGLPPNLTASGAER